jgi:hypothetical protein
VGRAALTRGALSPIIGRLRGLPIVALRALSSDYVLFFSSPSDEHGLTATSSAMFGELALIMGHQRLAGTVAH